MKSVKDAISCLGLAIVSSCTIAGEFNWELSNQSSAYSNDELHRIIRNGIRESGETPSLKKPWFLDVLVAGGSMNNASAEPGFILITKAKRAPDGIVSKCMKYNYGTYTKAQLGQRLGELASAMPGYVTSHPDCGAR